MKRKYQAFISSTYTDLVEERELVTKTLLDNKCIPVSNEPFFVNNLNQMDYIKKMLDDCDFYILLLAWRYSSLDTDGIGFIEKEYNYAKEKGIPIFAFVDKNIDKLKDSKLKHYFQMLISFRIKVLSENTVQYYSDIDELSLKVDTVIKTVKEDTNIAGWIQAIDVSSNEAILDVQKEEEINRLQNENKTLNKDIKYLNNKVKELEEENVKKQNEVSSLKKQNIYLYREVEELKNKASKYKTVKFVSRNINELIINSENLDTATIGVYQEKPIEWIIFDDKAKGYKILISKYVLDCKPYNEKEGSITWTACSLREWLNSTFYEEAFVSQNIEIKPVKVENKKNQKYGTTGGSDTEDKLFLMSIDEAKRYFKENKDRTAMNVVSNEPMYYWLRSPGMIRDAAACVNDIGNIVVGGFLADIDHYGVRPAFKVKY